MSVTVKYKLYGMYSKNEIRTDNYVRISLLFIHFFADILSIVKVVKSQIHGNLSKIMVY